MERIFPKRWQVGDQVSVAAPSFVFDLARVGDGLELFRELGFVPKIPEGLFAREGYFAGPDAHRAMLLSRALDDPETSGVICARGGYGAGRLLPQLPYSHLRENPKLLIGFSDITALSLALYQKIGLVTLHGPMLGTLRWDEESTQRLRSVVLGEPPGTMKIPAPIPLSGGSATGVLLGGNLCLIASLVGTPYLPSFRGAILYLEEVDEKPYRVDRMLTQLELAGILDEIAGVLIADFAGCEDPNYPEPSWLDVVELRLAKRGIPVVGGFPGGHRRANWPVLIGALATLDSNIGTLTIEEGLSAR